MSFGASQWLWGLLVVPVLVLLFAGAERRGTLRLRQFVSPHLFAELAGSVNRVARWIKFSLLLAAIAFACVALAQPRWGYVYDDTKRKGLDLIFAVDTSRSMLSNDVQPNRLQRVKLATQDLINALQGDRVGLIAFAGRAFLQAPLTIDYGAAIDAINDLDTTTIPEGGTNISAAINLAVETYGKSAVGNRALVIFTDGEELSGDATKAARAAADAGVRIFTIGVGTPQGSLIPIGSEDGGTAFVKNSKGEVVKSKLDEARLREVAEATDGIYLHLENGPRTMKEFIAQGLSKMKAGEIDARLARRPIERYEWPLGAAVLALAASLLLSDRKRRRTSSVAAVSTRRSSPASIGNSQKRRLRVGASYAASALIVLLLAASRAFATAPGLDLYQHQKFDDAYAQFQKTLQEHPQTQATDKIQFDAGAAAYKMKDYKKALESFSQALLSKDAGLQSKSHYNLGNTLYQRGDAQKADEKKLTDWQNALQHYEQTMKLDPQKKEAKENYEFVKKKIEELKKKKEQQPNPSPSPSPQSDKDKKKQDQKNQQPQPSKDQNQKDQQPQQDQQGGKDQPSKDKKNAEQPKPGESPSPSPGETPGESPSPSPGESPSPSAGQGEQKDQSQTGESPTPSANGEQSPSPAASASPSPGEGNESGEQGGSPSPTPAESPRKKFAGEVKGAKGDESKKSPQTAAAAAEPVKEGEMSPEQARRLLQSMKDEERRVQLDERKASRPVYNDW